MRILIRFLLVVVLLCSVAMVACRIVYDLSLIRSGDTFVVKKTSPDSYDFLLHIPRGYNDFSGAQPLLIFLHGAGEIGNDPETLRSKDPVFFARGVFEREETARFPFIVVTPISPERRWEPRRVVALLDQVLAETQFRFRIDPDRVYLTGYSMGGFGTFETAMEYPERFAAIVPVAGGGEPSKAEKLLDVATWVFHGEVDATVPIPSSALVVERMRELGHRDVIMTTFPRAGHGIVRDVYSMEMLYRWLLLKRKSRFGQEETFDRAFQRLQSPPPQEPSTIPDLLNHSTGSDTGNLIDSSATAEDLADPVITEEFHAE
jgi:predicted peptidase